jgi:hypothetical protein
MGNPAKSCKRTRGATGADRSGKRPSDPSVGWARSCQGGPRLSDFAQGRRGQRLAAERAHLTTASAGEIARAARVKRVEPFHFSRRYEGDEERLLREVAAAFEGRHREAVKS